jgi:hypothetical protein
LAIRGAAVAAVLLLGSLSIAVAQQAAPSAKPAAPKPTKPTVQAAPRDGGNCIGVVSAIGDVFTMKKVGIIVFQNEERTVPIDSWHIDDAVIAKAAAVLGKRLNVRRVSYPPGAFTSLNGEHPLFYDRGKAFDEILRNVTASTKCDRYVVIAKAGSRVGSTNQGVDGLGILWSASVTSTYMLHSLYAVILYNGQDFSVLARKAVSGDGSTFFAFIRGPHREVDETWWPAAGAAPSPMVRDAIRAMVEQSLEKPLSELFPAN